MDKVDDASIKYGILLFVWADYIWKLFLSIRQYKISQKTTEVPTDLLPIVKQETFTEARKYSLAKQKYGIASDFFETLTTTAVILCGILGQLWDFSATLCENEELPASLVWTFCTVTLSSLVYMPWNAYYHFVVEQKFGFNNQTFSFFMQDEIKSFILSQTLYLTVTAIATVVVKLSGDIFFPFLWLSLGIMYLALMVSYPFYIAPLFDEFTPLPESELREEIQKLAEEVNFPLSQIYVVKESRRSNHSNAYYAGLFQTKRIVIYDNLLNSSATGGCENDEVLAVLSHELGHWKHGHLAQKFSFAEINLFLTSCVFQLVYFSPIIYRAFGFHNVTPVVPGLLFTVQYLMPYNLIASFFKLFFLDRMESQADDYGRTLRKTDALVRALVKTHKDNLDFPIYDNLYCTWYHSSSTLLEKIAALETKATS